LRAPKESLLQDVGRAVRLARGAGLEGRAKLPSNPFGHLFEGLIHASEVHIKSWLRHSSKLRNTSCGQRAVAVPVDRFENRLKQATPRTFLVHLA
jgi:hypothetical protein